MPGKCSFRPSWLCNNNYRQWLERGKTPGEAGCKVCRKSFDISNMGEAAVKSHMGSKNHAVAMQNVSMTLPVFKRTTTTSDKDDSVATPTSSSSASGTSTGNLDVDEIPDPVAVPTALPSVENGHSKVFFDLETTGLGRQSHITQIAAVGPSGSFNRYVIPEIPIQQEASRVTGLEYVNKQMYFRNQPVHSVPLKMALQDFFDYLGQQPVMLVGHNIKTFDCHVLLNAARACHLEADLDKCVACFLDTLPLMKGTYKGLKSYKQESLNNHFFHEDYVAHNALADVWCLQRLIEHACPDVHTQQQYTFSLKYVVDVQVYNKVKADNFDSWKPLIECSSISKWMAQKAAASGLTLQHLRLAHTRNGFEGIESLLSEVTSAGKPRVTRNRVIISRIAEYFAMV